jgi:hypothetical protein
MLRYGLLGGSRPKLPWEFFVSLGGGTLGAGGMFVFLYPLWGSYFVLGLVEVVVFAGIGGALVTVGGLRRRREARRTRDAPRIRFS